ncbi:DUF4355 domain-containing protein [Limosilactobacillus reuteri]|uniref:DUF4355 domain-containing protein n=1 Tax=Limosilactobacillus reuteri TaxID=1598 RepID=UPI001E5F7C34|nr:DUF4355 domain-containing protein [Limosilactobacillus reuteri]MCC4470024.1 DUF4355 domain-containing protein [Limosilactobacillus reuteri]
MNEEEQQIQQPGQDDAQQARNQDQEAKVVFSPEQQAAMSKIIDSKVAKINEKHTSEINNLNQQWEQKKNDAVKTAEERAKMSAEERAKAEQEDREKAMAQERQDLARQKREYATKSMLLDKGISTDMLPLVMGADDEATSKNLDLLNDYVNKKVQEATEKLMQGKQNPTSGNGSNTVAISDNPWTAQAFNLTKQQEIFNQDPEKARQMIAQAQPTQGFYIGKMN